MNRKIIFILLIIFSNQIISQKKQIDSLSKKELIAINPLTPSKAAFYSAVIPGLGQIYTKKFWKLPLVYGMIGSSIYGYHYNNKEMKRYRVAYKRRLAGYIDDEFYGRILREDQLIEGYKYHRKYRDVSALFILGSYLLNILDANIGAHLLQFNVNENLVLRPKFKNNVISRKTNLGLCINLKF